MQYLQEFESIRPIRDNETQEVIKRLLHVNEVKALIKATFPNTPYDQVSELVQHIQSVDEFQQRVIYKVVTTILERTSKGLTVKGNKSLDKSKAYLFISNHRDIVLDPAILNYALSGMGITTAEVAIGDNLMSKTWVSDLARLNKSFLVKRNLPPRDLIQSSRVLSSYIKYSLLDQRNSVWIAQREGRAKDGNDKTQPGVLNMIGLANDEDYIEYFASLNITPISISYEQDPCDMDKVQATYNDRYEGGHVKGRNEDNFAMKKGIVGNKGAISLFIGEPLNEQIASLPKGLHKSEVIDAIRSMLDINIIHNFQTTVSNYIAYDLFNNTNEFQHHYTKQDEENMLNIIDNKVSQLEGDKIKLKELFLEKYSRPIANKKELGVLSD